MPVISGGGGAGGPAAGSYLPVAKASGVTVDTTTYNNPFGAGKLAVLMFPAGTNQALLATAQVGDAFPRLLLDNNMGDGWYFGDGTIDPETAANIATGSGGGLELTTQGTGKVGIDNLATATISGSPPKIEQVSPLTVITSGALPTVQLVTATGAQISTTRDAETVTPCTFNPGAATTATVTVALSPDNVTYSTLAVVTEPAGVALDGTILPVKVRVPAGWYLKLTVNAQATLGLTTWY